MSNREFCADLDLRNATTKLCRTNILQTLQVRFRVKEALLACEDGF